MLTLLAGWKFIRSINPHLLLLIMLGLLLWMAIILIYRNCDNRPVAPSKEAVQAGQGANNAQRNADVISGQMIEQNKTLSNADSVKANIDAKIDPVLTNVNAARNANYQGTTANHLEKMAANYQK